MLLDLLKKIPHLAPVREQVMRKNRTPTQVNAEGAKPKPEPSPLALFLLSPVINFQPTMGGPFSRRHGYRGQREITVREDAPEGLRIGLLQILHDDLELTYKEIRQVVCNTLRTLPDSYNSSEIPNVRDEVSGILQNCAWYHIYDIIEAFYRYLESRTNLREIVANEIISAQELFPQQINQLFEEEGIGWQMIEGQIITRGPEEFEHTVGEAVARADEAGFQTAKRELEEARRDLSRRPEPDITGTVQHCMAALECTARTVSGDERATLGEIIARHAGELEIPRPLANAIERMWGYASEMARHLREGRVPAREEAELLLSTSAALITYLIQKHGKCRR